MKLGHDVVLVNSVSNVFGGSGLALGRGCQELLRSKVGCQNGRVAMGNLVNVMMMAGQYK